MTNFLVELIKQKSEDSRHRSYSQVTVFSTVQEKSYQNNPVWVNLIVF